MGTCKGFERFKYGFYGNVSHVVFLYCIAKVIADLFFIILNFFLTFIGITYTIVYIVKKFSIYRFYLKLDELLFMFYIRPCIHFKSHVNREEKGIVTQEKERVNEKKLN